MGAGGAIGAYWGCLSQDRATRFVIAWAFAGSEEQAAPEVVARTRQRTHHQAGRTWISDGNPVYARQIRQIYRDPHRSGQRGRPRLVPTPNLGLTQTIKQRQHGRVVGITVRAVLGEASTCPSVVCEERLNGVLRDRLNCLTRKTHAFAKQGRTWKAAVVLCLFEHNWIRAHRALREAAENLPQRQRYQRRTPAMAMGLSDHIWSWTEFLTYQIHPY